MAIAFVSSVTGPNQNATGSTTIATSSGLNTASGNMIVVGIRSDGANSISSVSDTAGNSYIKATDYSGSRLAIYYAVNVVGNASNIFTCTFSGSNTFREILACQYSGVLDSSPYDITSIGTSTTTTVASATFSTSYPNELIFCLLDIETTGTTWTAGTGYTLRAQNADKVLVSQDNIVSSIQSSVSVSATNTDNGTQKKILIATFAEMKSAYSGSPIFFGNTAIA